MVHTGWVGPGRWRHGCSSAAACVSEVHLTAVTSCPLHVLYLSTSHTLNSIDQALTPTDKHTKHCIEHLPSEYELPTASFVLKAMTAAQSTDHINRQAARLSQRDHMTHSISWNLVNWCTTLWNIPFDKLCNRIMSLKTTQVVLLRKQKPPPKPRFFPKTVCRQNLVFSRRSWRISGGSLCWNC